ncbi:MAG: RHS repeat-associated core domain-containing protein, partial [Candidatus Delongbacteria bacterium]|nr:RHS repeat-associated core domain-containing protein [Candidatus Delongbacteria bacterium]
SDHLGSSTVITDSEGKYYEHTEYFPYGEVWVNERSSEENYDMPYKYTGKEYDPETKLTYYGARYYDAKLSRWISVDPPLISGAYLGNDPSKLPGMGGVFNPINLDAYQYGGMNPVKYVDADGNAYAAQRSDGKYNYMSTSKYLDVAYEVIAWFPGSRELANCIHDKKGLTRIPSHYDDSILKSDIIKSLGLSSATAGQIAKFKKLGNFGKGLGKVAGAVGLATNAYSIGSAALKDRSTQDSVEFIIEQSGMLQGFDKEFIGLAAPYVEKSVERILQRDGVSIQHDNMGKALGSTGKFSREGVKDLQSLYNNIRQVEKKWNAAKADGN